MNRNVTGTQAAIVILAALLAIADCDPPDTPQEQIDALRDRIAELEREKAIAVDAVKARANRLLAAEHAHLRAIGDAVRDADPPMPPAGAVYGTVILAARAGSVWRPPLAWAVRGLAEERDAANARAETAEQALSNLRAVLDIGGAAGPTPAKVSVAAHKRLAQEDWDRLHAYSTVWRQECERESERAEAAERVLAGIVADLRERAAENEACGDAHASTPALAQHGFSAALALAMAADAYSAGPATTALDSLLTTAREEGRRKERAALYDLIVGPDDARWRSVFGLDITFKGKVGEYAERIREVVRGVFAERGS